MVAGRPPPGRAGRVWLAGRVDVAGRAAKLLDHKQQLLRREEARFAALAERTHRDWEALAAEAGRRSAQALVAGGRDALHRAAAAVGEAHAELTWTTEAGVTYPSTATTRLPPPPALGGDVALVGAADACRRALAAAVQDAAAAAALERVSAECVATAHRLRAIRDRLLPELRAELVDADRRLEETEREETTRLRWTQRRQPTDSEVGR